MSTRGDRDRRVAFALAAITALALALRLYRLDFQSLWSDEIYSLALAGATLAESLQRVAGDVHPPLYFLALHVWAALFGNSEFSLRLLSALPSALAIPLLFVLGRRLFGVRAGLAAAAIAAVSLFQIYYAQEVRSYALMSFLAILSMDAFTRWVARGPSRSANRSGSEARAAGHTLGIGLYYVAVTSALLYTHYFGIFVVAVQNLWWVGVSLAALRASDSRRASAGATRAPHPTLGPRAWVGAQLAIAALFALWLPVVLQQSQSVGDEGFWIREPGSYMLFRSLLIGTSVHRPPWGFLIPWDLLLRNFLLLAAAFWALALFRGGGRGGARPEPSPEASDDAGRAGWALLALCALWLVVPALAAFGLSKFSLNVYTHRNLIVSSPALFLLLGALVARLPGRVLPALLLAAALAPSTAHYPWHYGSVHKSQWREMVDWLGERAEPEDGFVFDAPFIRRNYDFYRGTRNYHFVDLRQKRRPRRQRIWLIRAHQAEEERRIQAVVEAWGYGSGPPRRFKDIDVFLYERR